MIKIYSGKNRITKQEKKEYGEALGIVIKQLREFQAAVKKEEKRIEVNCLIVIN